MKQFHSQMIFNPVDFSDAIKQEILEKLPSKDLFCLLKLNEPNDSEKHNKLDKKSFGVVAKIILHRKKAEDQEAPLYQEKLLRMFSQMENTEVRNRLLEIKVGSHALIDIIKEFANEAEGKAVMSAWVLLAQYANKTLVMDEALIQSLTKAGILHVFSPFLTPTQCETYLIKGERFPPVVETKESIDETEVDAELNEIEKGLKNLEDTPELYRAEEQLKKFIYEASPTILAHHMAKILKILENNFHTSSSYFIARSFGMLIKRAPDNVFTKSDDIFNIIEKLLCCSSPILPLSTIWDTLQYFIERAPDPILSKKGKTISRLIENGLTDQKKETLGSFFAFIKKTHTIYFNINKILYHIENTLSIATSYADDQAEALSVICYLIERESAVFFEIEKIFGPHSIQKEEGEGVERNILNAPEKQDISQKVVKIGSLIIQKLDDGIPSSVKKAALDVLVACIKKKVPLKRDLWVKGFFFTWKDTLLIHTLMKQNMKPCLKKNIKDKFHFLNILTVITKHYPSALIENKALQRDMTEAEKVFRFLHALVPSNVIKENVKEPSSQITFSR